VFRRAGLARAFAAVRLAWHAAWARGLPTSPALDAALDALVDVARRDRLLTMDVFEAVTRLPARERDGDDRRAWDQVRQHAGRRLTRRYYAGPDA
jgi:hypothetical protein